MYPCEIEFGTFEDVKTFFFNSLPRISPQKASECEATLKGLSNEAMISFVSRFFIEKDSHFQLCGTSQSRIFEPVLNS